MSHNRHSRFVVTGFALVALLAACGDGASTDTTDPVETTTTTTPTTTTEATTSTQPSTSVTTERPRPLGRKTQIATTSPRARDARREAARCPTGSGTAT